MPARHLATASLFVLGLAACGGDDVAGVDGGGIDAALGDPNVLSGFINVDLVDSEPDYTSVSAVVNDKATPALVMWNTMTTDGDCQLQIPEVPFCSTPCGSAGACVANDTCAPNAVTQDVGTLHIAGIHTTSGSSEFDLSHIVSSSGAHNYLVPGTVSLAYPGFAAGDAITATSSGSAFTPPFTATAAGIAPLALTSSDPALARNTALTVTWTPPASGGTSQIEVKLDISHHGGSKGKIVCTTADDGNVTLGAGLMTQLLDLGAAGFPTIELTRVVIGSALTTAGRVELGIRSMVAQPVTVPGVISCNDDTQCTPPATCQDDLTCR